MGMTTELSFLSVPDWEGCQRCSGVSGWVAPASQVESRRVETSRDELLRLETSLVRSQTRSESQSEWNEVGQRLAAQSSRKEKGQLLDSSLLSRSGITGSDATSVPCTLPSLRRYGSAEPSPSPTEIEQSLEQNLEQSLKQVSPSTRLPQHSHCSQSDS
jgi:hypothetical protein